MIDKETDIENISKSLNNAIRKELKQQVGKDPLYLENKMECSEDCRKIAMVKYTNSLEKAIKDVLFKKYNFKHVFVGYFTDSNYNRDILDVKIYYDINNGCYYLMEDYTWNKTITQNGKLDPLYWKLVDSNNTVYIFKSDIKVNNIVQLYKPDVYCLLAFDIFDKQLSNNLTTTIINYFDKHFNTTLNTLLKELSDDYIIITKQDSNYHLGISYTLTIMHTNNAIDIGSITFKFNLQDIKNIIDTTTISDDMKVKRILTNIHSKIDITPIGFDRSLWKYRNTDDIEVLINELCDATNILKHIFINKDNCEKINNTLFDIAKKLIDNRATDDVLANFNDDVAKLFKEPMVFMDDIVTKVSYRTNGNCPKFKTMLGLHNDL